MNLAAGNMSQRAALSKHKEQHMNWDQIQGNWKQFKGRVRNQWGKLTDDHLEQINGRREILTGKIQQSYGISREEADRQIKDWQQSIDVSSMDA
jgi:uncharacterized protein YjbJ (UPF0337 family)